MSCAYEIFDKAFPSTRGKRSDAYRQGVIDVLLYRVDRHPTMPKFRYVEGTAEADAYFAGTDEGHCLARGYLDAQKEQS